jgi:hypothetical protein
VSHVAKGKNRPTLHNPTRLAELLVLLHATPQNSTQKTIDNVQQCICDRVRGRSNPSPPASSSLTRTTNLLTLKTFRMTSTACIPQCTSVCAWTGGKTAGQPRPDASTLSQSSLCGSSH